MGPGLHRTKQWASVLTGLFLVMCMRAVSQISPGDLSRPHAQLEGISNCTKCHVLGEKVSNEKCLDCHKEIQSRINEKKGYHASAEVRGKDCFSCHSDHHGRDFDIVRFDEEKFNHQLTGFNLTGAHQEVDCRSCHKSEWITSETIRKKSETYLGLSNQCATCHVDVHKNTLSNNCASCHNTEAFKPAVLFDHNKTEFPLRGKHEEADCRRCHEVTFSEGRLYQQFSGIPFSNCTSCHDDVHNNRLGTQCKQCHTEESFQELASPVTFNHQRTGYPLEGRHKKIDCASCHVDASIATPQTVFLEFANREINNCNACHQDVHEQKFGTDCKSCHTVESFHTISMPATFSHDLTGFPLEGKHAGVDCKQCHDTRLTDPVKHNLCADCHEDFHQGQFNQAGTTIDCRECHTTSGFAGSTYSIEQHNAGSFPLTGAHLATPCFSCHAREGAWTFQQLGSQCADCHKDVHEGRLDASYYPGKNCAVCHTTDRWAEVAFDHLVTGFALQGKHQQVSCAQCHIPDEEPRTIPFSGLEQACYTCHEEVHGGQFKTNGITACDRCHTPEGWTPSIFNHDTARFVLDGAHRKVACKECHKTETMDEKQIILYRREKFECADCHQ